MLDGFKSADEISKKKFADERLKESLLANTAGLSGKEFAARIDDYQRKHGVRRVRIVETLSVIPMRSAVANDRHGQDDKGRPVEYKGYKGDSNYCIEIWRNEKGKWEGDVVSTFEAHRVAGESGVERLRHPKLSIREKPLLMRLIVDDCVKIEVDGIARVMRMVTVSSAGRLSLVDVNEANVDARNRDKGDEFAYTYKMPGTLQSAKGRRLTISPIGEVRDPGPLD
jgi:CRISPR-associated endonuclease Csn1